MSTTPTIFVKRFADALPTYITGPLTVLYANTLPGAVETSIPDNGYLLHVLFSGEQLTTGSANSQVFERSQVQITFRLYTHGAYDGGTYEALQQRDTMTSILRNTMSAAILDSLYTHQIDKIVGLSNVVQYYHETTDYLVENILCATIRVDLQSFI